MARNEDETAMSPFVLSLSSDDGRKCPTRGIQKPDLLIQIESYDLVGGIDPNFSCP